MTAKGPCFIALLPNLRKAWDKRWKLSLTAVKGRGPARANLSAVKDGGAASGQGVRRKGVASMVRERHFLGAVAVLLLARPVCAEGPADLSQGLALFERATMAGPVEGAPPAAAVYAEGALVGYLLSTTQVVQSTGFSAKPLDILVGVDRRGVIVGARLLAHQEPILLIGVRDADLDRFVATYRGHDIRRALSLGSGGDIDGVSGATVSSLVINDAILRAARAVAASRGILGSARAGLDFESFEPASWRELADEGSLVSLRLTVGEVAGAFERAGGRLFAPRTPRPDDEAPFVELHAGLATPARVGRNLVGARLYNRVVAQRAPDDQIIFVAGRGLYSFKGTRYRKTGSYDRLRLVQDGRAVAFTVEDHVRIDEVVAEGAPELREAALFVVPETSGFDPARPWRLQLRIEGREAEAATSHGFALAYELPERYRRVAMPVSMEVAELWRQRWRDRWPAIAVLGVGLATLTALLVVQDAVARRRRRYDALRIAFLIYTLVWVGWIAGAQLSVVNVLTFAESVMTEFRWDFFLLEPLIFILWSYVAVALLFWGRGVFCGWLCPFGAMQELLNRLARLARVPQWRLPFPLHERLWPIKYVIFLALFGLFLQYPLLAIAGAEVEPFKTAIVLGLDRPWPFVVYLLALLVAGLFVNRAFCRYLCPLGAALAIPARIRMFEWLKRRWQCGAPCQQCAQDCPVQAIHPEGKINPNECIHCLHCQVAYFDDTLCPPLIERRKRRETRAAARATAGAEA
jgi:transcriptional regulator of nitric oxide reductase